MSFIALTTIAVAAAVTAAIFWYRRYRKPEARLRRLLRKSGQAYLGDLVLPDAMDGHIHLDNLLWTEAGFIVIDTIRLDGAVFGAAHIDEWTVIHQGRSSKFRNPVQYNRNRTLAVRHLVPGVPVHGLVVLIGDIEFPKGVTDGVVTLDGLAAALAELPVAQDDGDWQEAWIALAACASR